tara:strand:- start:3373 stop:5157 length:1785 start_codon:yes stop_codon:yes gene_type:complete
MKIKYIDGFRLQRAIQAGINHVITRKDYLNKINVFPVPDGDTGTNMAFTLATISEETKSNNNKQVSKVADAIADASLNGARGNSGSILAQFFVGFADGVSQLQKLTPKRFSQAIRTAKNYSYDALSEPKEGTILSVISDWADSIKNIHEKHDDFVKILDFAFEEAKESLRKTPEKLAILKKSGVVDAGAQGFVDFLEGIKHFIENGEVDDVDTSAIAEPVENFEVDINDDYRFCTECLVAGDDINRIKLKEQLINLGSSIVLAGSKKKAKIHIHTNDPQAIFTLCNEYGIVTGEKADDMLKQQKDAHGSHKKIAIIVDSGCDLPEEILEEFNIHMVPVRLNFGDEHHVDKVTITPEEFWHQLKTNPIHPQTSQPTQGDFRRQYQFLTGHYKNAISIHLPASVSGTMQSAILAADDTKGLPVDLVDSHNGSVGIGLIALRAAEAVQQGFDKDEILQIVHLAVESTTVYIGLNTLDYVVKGGRVSANKKKIANLLRINPILSFAKNGINTIGKTFGSNYKTEKLVKFVTNKIPDGPFRVGLAHGNAPDIAEKARIHFEELGAEKVVTTEIGPALGVHAGPNSLVIAIQSLKDRLVG